MREQVAIVSGALALCICLFSIVGLLLGISQFSSIFPGYKSIALGAAIFWILLHTIIILYQTQNITKQLTYFFILGAIFIVIYNVMDTVFDLVGKETWYEEFLLYEVQNYFLTELSPISPVTSFLFIFAAFGIVFLLTGSLKNTKKFFHYSGISGLIVCVISFTMLLGYFYGSPLLYRTIIIPVSAPSALAGFLFGIALIFSSGTGSLPLSLFTGDSVRATLLRTYIPLTCFSVLLFSIINTGFYRIFLNSEAIFASVFLMSYISVTSLVLSKLTSGISDQIEEADHVRRIAEDNLKQSHVNLQEAYDKLALSEEELKSNLEELMQKEDELRQTLQYLQASEEKFRSLFESMKEGVVLHEIIYDSSNNPVDYRIIEANPASVIHTGLPLTDAKGIPASEFYQIKIAPFLEIYAKVADSRDSAFFESYYEPLEKYFSISVSSPKKGFFTTIFSDITEKKNTEEQIKIMNNILSQAQTVARLGSWLYTPHTGKILWSDELYRIYGYEPGIIDPTMELINSHIHPDDIIMHELFIRAAIEKQVYSPFEYRLIKNNGEVRYVTSLGTVETNNIGETVRIIGVIQDITDRKKIELKLQETNDDLLIKNEALAASYEELSAIEEEIRSQNEELKISEERVRQREEHLVLAQKIGKTGSFEIVLETGELIGSKEFFRIYGIPWIRTGEIPYDTLKYCTPAFEQLYQDISRLIASDNPFNTEFIIYPADESEPRTVRSIARVIKDSELVPVRVIGVIHDITHERRAEENLRETKEFLQNLIMYANSPIIVWNPKLQVTDFNNAFENLTGLNRNEIIGRNISVLFPEKSRSELLSLIQSMMHGERWESVTMQIQRSDGEIRTVIWNSAHITDPGGNMQAIVAMGTDITEQEILKQEKKVAVEQIERNLAELAILNDGIRNPLMIISAYAELKSPDSFEIIYSEVKRIDKMISQLDQRWMESEKILEFLRKHYHIKINER